MSQDSYSNLPSPTVISSLASIGIHAIIAFSLPVLSAYSTSYKPNRPGNVQVINLSPAEQSRIPGLAQSSLQLPSLPSLPSLPTQGEPLAGDPLGPDPLATLPPPPPLPSYPPPSSYPDSLPALDSKFPFITIPKEPNYKLPKTNKNKNVQPKVTPNLPLPPKVQKFVPPVSTPDASEYVATIPQKVQPFQNQNRAIKREPNKRRAPVRRQTPGKVVPTFTQTQSQEYFSRRPGEDILIEQPLDNQTNNYQAQVPDGNNNSQPQSDNSKPQVNKFSGNTDKNADFRRQEQIVADIRKLGQDLQYDKKGTSEYEENSNYLAWIENNRNQLPQDKEQANEVLAKRNLKKESFTSKNYPKDACLKKLEGTATVQTLVDANGNIIGEPKITKSSGYNILNTQAIKDVKDRTFENKSGKQQAYQIKVKFEYNREICPALNVQEPLQG